MTLADWKSLPKLIKLNHLEIKIRLGKVPEDAAMTYCPREQLIDVAKDVMLESSRQEFATKLCHELIHAFYECSNSPERLLVGYESLCPGCLKGSFFHEMDAYAQQNMLYGFLRDNKELVKWLWAC